MPPMSDTHDDPDDADVDDTDPDEAVYDLTGGKRSFGRRGRVLVALGIVAVAVAGIGAALAVTGDDSGSPESDDDSGRDPLADAFFEFAQCMRDNGLDDWPDPMTDDDGGVDFDPGGGEAYDLDDPGVAEATAECEPIIEEAESAGGGPSLTPEQQAELQDQALTMAQCMRGRGWDFPDPEVSVDGSTVGIAIGPGSDLPEPGDPDAEQFEQDQEECDVESGLRDPDEVEDDSD